MAKKSSKIFLIVSLSIIGLAILTGAGVSIFYKPYMAVYLTTGDMYFGKTSVFPCIKIQDPWFLQRAEDGSVSLQRFSDAFWMPRGGMRINRDQVIFISRIANQSPVAITIEGGGVTQQQTPVSNEETIDLESALGAQD
jgi:hypothetical protein